MRLGPSVLQAVQDHSDQRFRERVRLAVIDRFETVGKDVRDDVHSVVDAAFAFLVKNSSGPVRMDDCVQLSALLFLWGGDGAQILNGRMMSNSFLGIHRRIELAKESYMRFVNSLSKRVS